MLNSKVRISLCIPTPIPFLSVPLSVHFDYIIDAYNVGTVGCIAYMHLTLNSSLIYFNVISFRSNQLSKRQNNLKIFSLFFLYFYWHLLLYHFNFYALSTVWRFVYLLLPWGLILSRGSTYQHIGFTQCFGRLMVKTLKGQVSRCRIRANSINNFRWKLGLLV